MTRFALIPALAIASVLFFFACSHGVSALPPVSPVPPDSLNRQLTHELLYSGAQCGAIDKEPSLLWIKNAEGLGKVYNRINNHMLGIKRNEPPAVDFSTHGVFVLYMGLKPTTGYALAIKERAVSRTGDALDVNVDWIEPATGAIVAQALTSPCLILKIPAGDYAAIRAKDNHEKELARVVP